MEPVLEAHDTCCPTVARRAISVTTQITIGEK